MTSTVISMEGFKTKYVRFNNKDTFIPISIEIEDPKIKKFSKSFVIVSAFLIVTTLLSIIVAYGKNSNLGMGTYTSINRINNWLIPDNFNVRRSIHYKGTGDIWKSDKFRYKIINIQSSFWVVS